MTQTLRLFFPLFLAVICLFSTSVYAAPVGSRVIELEDFIAGIVPRNAYQIELTQPPEAAEGEFFIRLSVPMNVTGCAKMTKSESEKVVSTRSLRINVIDPQLKSRGKDVVRYGNYECRPQTNDVSINIPVNRDELLANKIERITIQSDKYGPVANFKIEVTQQTFDILTENEQGDVSRKQRIWFMPKDTVVLFAPHVKLGKDVSEMLLETGFSNGLVPLEDVIEGFTMPENVKNVRYFSDPSRKIRRQLQTADDMVSIGSISPTRTIYGADGAYEESYTVEVFARLPDGK